MPPWARAASTTARSEGGAFFQTLMGTPRISMVSTSAGEPGCVIIAWAWAMDIAGQPAGSTASDMGGFS